MIEAALEKAEQIITRQSIIRLAVQDQELLTRALQKEKNTKSTAFLKGLAAEYAAQVKST